MKKFAKISGVVLTAFTAMLMFGANGEAYIDPSVMTYVIQAVAGIVVAVGAVVGIYWRRPRKRSTKLSALMRIRTKKLSPTI